MVDAPTRVRAVSPSVPFVGALDVEAHASAMPEQYRMRGVFFSRCVGDLDRDQFERLPLRERPIATYVPFDEYPTGDYMRVFGAAATRVHPATEAREAWRRYAREEVVTFSRTILGGVTMSLLNDPLAALLRYPEVFAALARGPTAIAKKLDARGVAIELRGAHAPVEYTIGVLEGIVQSFQRHPRIDVTSDGCNHAIEVRWTM